MFVLFFVAIISLKLLHCGMLCMHFTNQLLMICVQFSKSPLNSQLYRFFTDGPISTFVRIVTLASECRTLGETTCTFFLQQDRCPGYCDPLSTSYSVCTLDCMSIPQNFRQTLCRLEHHLLDSQGNPGSILSQLAWRISDSARVQKASRITPLYEPAVLEHSSC